MKPSVSKPTPTTVPPTPDGRSSRWDEHRAARRDELIEATIRAVRRHGPTVGMEQIAAVAGTSKAVIYRYFSDKVDLYRAVGCRVADELLAELDASRQGVDDPQRALRQGVDAYLQVLEENPALYRFVVMHPPLDQQHVGDEVVANYIGRIAGQISSMLRDWLAAAGSDPSGAAPWGAGVVGFVRAAGEWWLENPNAMTRAQLTEYVMSWLWSGATSRLGSPLARENL